MKKTILIMIALTIVGNANMCNYHIVKLDKTVKNARNFLANNMEHYMKTELTKVKFYAVHVLSECNRKDQIDLANHALLVAKAFGSK